MLTVNELAEKLGVSRQTVYNVIKSAGLSLDSLTAKREGNKRFFKDSALDDVKAELVKQPSSDKAVKIDEYNVNSQIQLLTLENRELKNRLDSMQKSLDQAETEKQYLLQQLGQLTDAVKAANVVSAQLMAATSRKKEGLFGGFKRLFGGKVEDRSGGEQ